MMKDSEALYARIPGLREWNELVDEQAVLDLRNKKKLKAKLRKEVKPIAQIVRSPRTHRARS